MSTTSKTRDLYFAAYLQADGVQMTGSERIDGRVHFTFAISAEEFDQRRQSWATGAGMISARRYSESIKSLKSVVFND